MLVKVFLHLGKGEQKDRLLARLDDPTEQWKVSANDNDVRARWEDYKAAYLA